ncbi:MAG: ABC transporter permease [bacterium]
MRSWLDWVCLLAAGVSVTLMLSLLWFQAAYTGGGEPLRALVEPDCYRAMWVSFYTATVASVAALALAIPTGYALSRWHFRGMWLVEAFLLIPVIMSPMALGVALLLAFRDPPGLWVARWVVFEKAGIMVAQFFVAYAFAVLIIRTTFSSIDVRLEQVARFLGCSPGQAFWRVTLPLAWPGILAGFVLGWARSLGDFGATSTLAGAVKGKTETAPVFIYLNLASVSIERAVALSIVLTLVTIAVLVLVRLLLGGRRG